MSNIAELQLLIRKEWERGGELDTKVANKCRLLKEAEDKKHKIMWEILHKELAALKEENMRKEEELREIEKRRYLL